MSNLKQKIEAVLSGIDAAVISSPSDVCHFVGYGGEGLVIISGAKATFVTDRRYDEEARAVFADVTVCKTTYLDTAIELLSQHKGGKFGVQFKSLTLSDCEKLKNALNCDFFKIDEKLKTLREVKTDDEVRRIKAAAKINDLAFSRTLEKVKEGMTEKDLAAEIEYQMRLAGADGIAFPTIAAFGENGSKPHAKPTDKRLSSGILVTLDFGCIFENYASDITRTFAFGKVGDDLKKIYNTVLSANQAGIAAVKSGIPASDVDQAARSVIDSAGFGDCFIHSTGHGVGLDVHESPAVSKTSTDTLKSGMILTVEPGIYMENLGGVRVEDLVLVTENGCEVLSSAPKELLII